MNLLYGCKFVPILFAAVFFSAVTICSGDEAETENRFRQWPPYDEVLAGTLGLTPVQRVQWNNEKNRFHREVEFYFIESNKRLYHSFLDESYANLYAILNEEQLRIAKAYENFRTWKYELKGKVDVRVLGRTDVKEFLRVTADQKEAFDEIEKGLEKKIAEREKEFQDRISELDEEVQSSLEDILTQEQRQKYKSVLGEPFNFDACEIPFKNLSEALRLGKGQKVDRDLREFGPLLTVAPSRIDAEISHAALLRLATLDCLEDELKWEMGQSERLNKLTTPIFDLFRSSVEIRMTRHSDTPEWQFKQDSGETVSRIFLKYDEAAEAEYDDIANKRQQKRLNEVYWQWVIRLKTRVPLLHEGWNEKLYFNPVQLRKWNEVKAQYVTMVDQMQQSLIADINRLDLESIAEATKTLNDDQLAKWKTLAGPFFEMQSE